MKEANFKETEIGKIPVDWEVKFIGEVLSIRHGRDQKNVIDEDGEFNIYGTGGILGKTNSFLYDKPSVLIGRKGTIDKPRFLDKPFWTVDTLFFSEIIKGNSPKFIFYLFDTIKWYNYNEASGVPSLNARTIESIQIPLPPLAEQEKIAKVLSDTDLWIESTEALLAKKRQIIKGAMQKLLSPKEDWEVRKLGEVLQFGSGKDYKHLQSGDIPVYGTGGIMTYVNQYLYDGESVGIGRKGTIDKPVFLKNKFWTVDTLFFTYSFIDAVPKYIYYQFLLIKWKEYNEASGVPSLNKNTLEQIEIKIPSLKIQREIAEILSSMDLEIEFLENRLQKARNIKQGMMQDLLTGKVRLG